jgi:hypothetical protein
MSLDLAQEWWLILLGGLLGSSHCLGMCGGFVLLLGSQKLGFWRTLGRQLVYALGRVSTYTLAGALVGYGGWRLTLGLQHLLNLQAWFAILAGVLLILQGLFSAGLLRWLWRPQTKTGCLVSSFAALLQAKNWSTVFVAGLANGLLPCGLVYAYLALAASTTHMGHAALVMFLFGVGTMPLLLLLGCGGMLLRLSFRRYLHLVAAWCVIITGLLSLIRGLHLLQELATATMPGCSGH